MPAYPIEKIQDIAKELWKEIIYIDVDISIRDKSRIPDYQGVYILTNRRGERYIGSSINILNRQTGHGLKKAIRIDVFLTEDIIHARILEKYLINALNPELNGYIQKTIDIYKIRTLEEIKKTEIMATKEYLKNIKIPRSEYIKLTEDYINTRRELESTQ